MKCDEIEGRRKLIIDIKTQWKNQIMIKSSLNFNKIVFIETIGRTPGSIASINTTLLKFRQFFAIAIKSCLNFNKIVFIETIGKRSSNP